MANSVYKLENGIEKAADHTAAFQHTAAVATKDTHRIIPPPSVASRAPSAASIRSANNATRSRLQPLSFMRQHPKNAIATVLVASAFTVAATMLILQQTGVIRSTASKGEDKGTSSNDSWDADGGTGGKGKSGWDVGGRTGGK